MIDFKTLKRTGRPNDYLVADPDTCPNAKSDRVPPVYPVAPEAVYNAWRKVVARQPKTTEHAADKATMTFEYVQRSRIFGFPDRVTVQFLSLKDGTETKLLVYSASRVGYSDLGVNARRVTDWLSALQRELAGA